MKKKVISNLLTLALIVSLSGSLLASLDSIINASETDNTPVITETEETEVNYIVENRSVKKVISKIFEH